jgi:metal-sulfur cluster biosynthetic enzyme
LPPTEKVIRTALSEILDPCSVSAGVPASLEDMGLVRSIRVTGRRVEIVLGLTEPLCIMGGYFLQEAHRVVGALEAVDHVAVSLDPNHKWTDAELSASYAQRLRDHRAARVTIRSGVHP